MTEADWLACNDPEQMLLGCPKQFGERKLRLFACACVRRIWHLIPDELGRRAVTVTEAFIEGAATEGELRSIADVFYPCGQYNAVYNHPATRAAHCVLYPQMTGVACIHCQRALRGPDRNAERVPQANLLRHIVGNPFQPPPKGGPRPDPVMALAAALYAGEPCHEPLHDALLEAGRADLAEHFRTKDHPRGCWALDLILGKI